MTSTEMTTLLREVAEQAGGEAPDFVIMSPSNWATLGWGLIPSWVRLKWAKRRRGKLNGYVAVTMREYRLSFGEVAPKVCRSY